MASTINYRIGVEYKLYTVTDGVEELEEQTNEGQPFRYLSGFGMALEEFETQTVNLNIGDSFDFTLTPDKAYGEYSDEAVLQLDKQMFTIDGKFDNTNVQVGNIIQLQNAEGQQFPAIVQDITADKVVVDLNHPLAGKTLHFVGKVVEKVEPSAQEIQAVLAHLTGGGCGGCGGGSCGGNCGGSCGDGECGGGNCGCK